MRTYPIIAGALLAIVTAFTVACGGSTTSPTTTATTTSATLTNEVVTGTVAAPVNGVLQVSSNPFTVTTGGNAISITLTSAVETMPDGSLLPTVTMGLGVGLWANNTCSLLSNAYTTAQGSSVKAIGCTERRKQRFPLGLGLVAR